MNVMKCFWVHLPNRCELSQRVIFFLKHTPKLARHFKTREAITLSGQRDFMKFISSLLDMNID